MVTDLENKTEELTQLADELNTQITDKEMKILNAGDNHQPSITEQIHSIAETLRTLLHDDVLGRFYAIQCELIRELQLCKGQGSKDVNNHVELLMESYANTNKFTHPPKAPSIDVRKGPTIIIPPVTLLLSPPK